jgi:hypothetical protein
MSMRGVTIGKTESENDEAQDEDRARADYVGVWLWISLWILGNCGRSRRVFHQIEIKATRSSAGCDASAAPSRTLDPFGTILLISLAWESWIHHQTRRRVEDIETWLQRGRSHSVSLETRSASVKQQRCQMRAWPRKWCQARAAGD